MTNLHTQCQSGNYRPRCGKTQQYGALHTDTERSRRRTHNLYLYRGGNSHLLERRQHTKGQRRLNTAAYESEIAPLIDPKNGFVRPHTPYSAKLKIRCSPTDLTPRVGSRSPQLKCKGSVNGKVVQALIDSGAEDNFINEIFYQNYISKNLLLCLNQLLLQMATLTCLVTKQKL